MSIFHTLILYLYSVLGHWFFSFGGIALVVFALCEKYWQKTTPSKWFWGLAALCIFIATLQAWNDEHQKRKEEAVYLIADTPRLVPGGVSTSPVWFPVGKSPQVNLVWGMFGKDPALNIRIDIECFVADELSVSSQESIINAFVQKWTSRKDYLSSTGNPSLFPEGPHFGGTCHSESVVDDDMRADIGNGRKFVYILAVSRFKDSMGEHEAHACKLMETHLSDSQELFGYVAWHECNKFISQVDISDP